MDICHLNAERVLCVIAVVAVMTAALAAEQGTTRDAGMEFDDTKPLNFKVHFIEKTAMPPKLDGVLDDACWQTATPLTDFANAQPVPPIALKLPPTEIRYLWDDKYLYLGVKCWEDSAENMAGYRRRVEMKALAIHDRDVLELHVDGKNDEWTKHTLWMNGAGDRHGQWDYDFGWGLLTDSGWSSKADWKQAAREDKDERGEFWCVEARVALADLEIKPKVGYIFGMEPTRFRFEKKWYAADGSLADSLPGGVNGGCAGLQIYAWGTQGVWHQQKDRFGKCILVERKPSDLVSGLRLAYPDLDRRTVRIRATDGFLTVKGGKITNESYAGKCASLVKEAYAALKRLDRIAGISYAGGTRSVASVSQRVVMDATERVPPIEKILSAVNCFQTNTLAQIQNEENVLRNSPRVTAAALDKLEKRVAAWSGEIERVYCETLCRLLLRERKVRYPIELDPGKGKLDFSGVVSGEPKMCDWKDPTLVRWAIPSRAGRKRVLVCCYGGEVFGAQHLMNRVDVDCDIVTLHRGSVAGVDGDHIADVSRGNHFDNPALVEHALARGESYDGIVAINCNLSRWPAKFLCRLAELQLKGLPIALINSDGWGDRFQPLTDFAEGAPCRFDKLVSDNPVLRVKRPESIFTGPSPYALHWEHSRMPVPRMSSFGAGRIVQLTTETPECRTIPIYPSFGPSFSVTPDSVFQDEYCLAYSCRVVMEALGMRGPAKARRLTLDDARTRQPFGGALTVTTAKAFDGAAILTVRNNWGKVLETQRLAVRVSAGESKVAFRCRGLEPGEYWVDAILTQDGRKCDFAAERLTIAPHGSDPAIASLRPDKECFEKDEDPTATVTVRNPTRGLVIAASVRDPRRRVLARGEFAVNAKTGLAQISFAARRFRLNGHFIDVTLKNARGEALDVANAPFWRRIGDLDDMRIFDGTTNAGGKDIEPRLALFGWHGLDLLQGGSRSLLYYGCDPAVRNRIPGRCSNWQGPISSPAWHRWLSETYGKQARDLRTRNGRFISLGDDSGCPNGFGRGLQDWVALYFHWVERGIRDAVAAQRGKSAATVIRAWADAHGLDWLKTDDNVISLVEGLKRGANFRKFLATAKFSAEDLTRIVQICRESYADIHILNLSNGVDLKDFSEINEQTIRTFKPVDRVELPYFIVWLEKRYGTVEKLNAAWGGGATGIKSFKEINETLIDSLKRLGHYTAEIDKANFLEAAFLENCRIIGETVHAVDPTIRVGFGASNLGNCWFDVFKYLDTAVPYWGRESTDLIRCTKHGYVGETMGLYGTSYGSDAAKVPRAVREKEAWHALLSGMNFLWMWTTNPGVSSARSIHPNSFGYAFECCREMLRGPAALILRSVYETDGIKIFYSRDCAHLGAVKTTPSTHGGSRGQWCTAINALGLQYAHVTADDIEAGALAKAKLLVLPMADVVSEMTARRIGAFLARGGTVFADFKPGTYGADGRKLPVGTLDELMAKYPQTFKVFNSSMGKFTSKIGRPEVYPARVELLKEFAAIGIVPQIRVVDAQGRDLQGVEITRFTRGSSYVFSIEKGTFAGEVFPMKAFVELAQPGNVYDVRAGQAVAKNAKRFEIALQGMDERVFSVQPYVLGSMTLKTNGAVKGGTLELEAQLAGVPATDTRVFRVEFVPPEGFPKTEFPPIRRYVEDAPGGVLKLSVPLAFNERDDLTIEVTDVASGLTTTLSL